MITMRHFHSYLALLLLSVLTAFVSVAHAAAPIITNIRATVAGNEPVIVAVDGKANPFLAGMPVGSEIRYPGVAQSDAVPANAAVAVALSPFRPADYLLFRASGTVTHSPNIGPTPPDGNTVAEHTLGAHNGVSAIVAPINSLVAVFLGDGDRTIAPDQLEFSSIASRNYLTLAPALQQLFFIGDGVTDFGQRQRIRIPPGATWIYLAVMDAFEWSNNQGAFTVHVEATTGGSGHASTVLIGLNFAANDPDEASSSLSPSQQAGAISQRNWNNLSGPNGSATSGIVADRDGVAESTQLQVVWSAPNTWRSGANNGFPNDLANRSLFSGYLDTTDNASGGVSIGVTGLGLGQYDVYVYFLSDAAAGRGGAYTLMSDSGTTTKFGSTFAQPSEFVEDPGTDLDNTLDGTHLRFQRQSGPSFTLQSDASRTIPNGFRAPVSAIQIVPIISRNVSGEVKSRQGNPLSSVSVEAIAADQVLAATITDAQGRFRLYPIGEHPFTLRARKAEWTTAQHYGITLGISESIQRNFALDPRPENPNLQLVPRIPEATQTPDLHKPGTDQLMVFTGDFFSSEGQLDRDKMTVVLTHGWASNPDVWALRMARAIWDRGIHVNIVAWDWETVAAYHPPGRDRRLPPRVSQDTPAQGLALGATLYDTLGSNYSHPIHFMGHSLGTLVNAAAINFLHDEIEYSNAARIRPAFPWNNPIHVTIFDEAELATSIQDAIPFVAGSFIRSLPRRSVWADNYYSLFGFYHTNAVNVFLQRGLNELPFLDTAHAYPMSWYTQTIVGPIGPLMGFRHSFEIGGPAFQFPIQAPYDHGALFLQSRDPITFELGLTGITNRREIEEIDGRSRRFSTAVFQTSAYIRDSVIQTGGEVAGAMFEATMNAFEGAASLGATVVNRTVTGFAITIGLRSAPPRAPAVQPTRAAFKAVLNTPAYAWLNVDVPPGATSLIFDFSFEGDGEDDYLAAGINGQNVFALETKFIAANEILTSGSIDVSPYAGQTIELFFGLLGGTSTDATATVQSIRFYTTTPPSLTVAASGGNATLQWPAWATHYSLESTADLNTPDWQYIPDLPTFTDTTQTLTIPTTATTRFFRLRL